MDIYFLPQLLEAEQQAQISADFLFPMGIVLQGLLLYLDCP